MQPPQALPGFWIFMYRVSPLTYVVDGIAATGMHAKPVVCASNEFSRFAPPAGQTCGQYLSGYLASAAGSVGQLVNPESTTQCEYCPLTVSDQYLSQVAITYDTRWRNYGIGFAFIFFNIFAAVLLYYVFRVKHWNIAAVAKGPSKFVDWVGEGGRWIRTGLVGHGKKIPEEGSRDQAKGKGNRIY